MNIKPKTEFKHDCSSFPEECDRAIVFKPGASYLVPDDVGRYFIENGWAIDEGNPDESHEPGTGETTLAIDNASISLKAEEPS